MMLTNTFSSSNLAAVMLACAAMLTFSLVDGSPQGGATGTALPAPFSRQQLNAYGAFGNPDFKIIRVIPQPNDVFAMAKAAYRENGKDVGAVIKCVNHQARDKKAAQALISRISNELSAYRIIKGNENGYNGELKQGQNYISRFLGQVMEGQWQCILTTEANGPNLLDYFTNLKVLNDRIERGFLFLKQVAMGMAYLNAIGIAQRDVKPENILVDITNPNNPAAMITNFDAALIRSPQELCRVLSTERVGTPLYNPPELYRCAAASTKVSTMQRIKGMFGGGNNNPNSCTIQEYNTCTKDVGSLGMSFINSVIGHPVIYPMETPRIPEIMNSQEYENRLNQRLAAFSNDKLVQQLPPQDKQLLNQLVIILRQISNPIPTARPTAYNLWKKLGSPPAGLLNRASNFVSGLLGGK